MIISYSVIYVYSKVNIFFLKTVYANGLMTEFHRVALYNICDIKKNITLSIKNHGELKLQRRNVY